MSDITDEATTIEIMWTAHSIKKAQAFAYEPKPITSQCLYCGDPVKDETSSFCSYGPESCATDYNKAMEVRKRQGLK